MKTSDLLLIGLLATTGLAEDRFTAVAGKQHLSEQLSVFKVNKEDRYTVDGQGYFVGAGFQPSALLDRNGTLHVFFQARLDGSGDKSAKMIAHTASKDGGRSFSKIKFVNPLPMQTYAMSSFTRTLPSGAERISVMASLSIDETVGRLKHPALIKERLGIDVSSFSRKAACLILEYYSDDGGASWTRKEHHGVTDRVYKRNDRDYYLAFINLIGQAREIEKGPYAGRLILAGPLRGDYLPCPDHPKFRNYKPSSSLIYSDNNGESWQFGGVIDDETAFQHNEASAVPVNGGKQILMARRCNTQADGKTMHHSDDGGATWNPGFTTSVAATRCLQVLETSGDTVLCSAPGSKKRTNGRIYISRDHGLNWTYKQIDKGPFSYSTVNRLTDGYFICCYSLGHHGEKGIAARIFSTKWFDDTPAGRKCPGDKVVIAGRNILEILEQLGAEREAGAADKELLEYAKHFDRQDADKDGRHSKTEYIENGAHMNSMARRGIFGAADNNADGYVTRIEYVLNRAITDEAKAIVQKTDADKDGKITKTEFVAGISLTNKQLAGAVFDALDPNGDGTITIPEYLRVWDGWARPNYKAQEKALADRMAK